MDMRTIILYISSSKYINTQVPECKYACTHNAQRTTHTTHTAPGGQPRHRCSQSRQPVVGDDAWYVCVCACVRARVCVGVCVRARWCACMGMHMCVCVGTYQGGQVAELPHIRISRTQLGPTHVRKCGHVHLYLYLLRTPARNPVRPPACTHARG